MRIITDGSNATFYLPAVDSNLFAAVEATNVFGSGGFSSLVESEIGKCV